MRTLLAGIVAVSMVSGVAVVSAASISAPIGSFSYGHPTKGSLLSDSPDPNAQTTNLGTYNAGYGYWPSSSPGEGTLIYTFDAGPYWFFGNAAVGEGRWLPGGSTLTGLFSLDGGGYAQFCQFNSGYTYSSTTINVDQAHTVSIKFVVDSTQAGGQLFRGDTTPTPGLGRGFGFSATVIPEPASLSLLALGGLALLRRRK